MLTKNQREFFEEIRSANRMTQLRVQRMEEVLQQILNRLDKLDVIIQRLRQLEMDQDLTRLINR